MKVVPPWSETPTEVFSVYWQTPTVIASDRNNETMISILDGGILVASKLSKCKVIDASLGDFVFDLEDKRWYSLIWRPLAEAKIWAELWDHDPKAIEVFSALRRKFLL